MKITDLTPRSALELAASIEDRAAARYRALAEKFSDHEALAEVFTQLARDEAAWVNGALIRVDGGEHVSGALG